MTTNTTILVTGAGGHLGRRVVELLLEAGEARVIVGSRSPEKLADLVAKGAEARRVDFDDPASLATAFQGVDRLLLVSTDALAVPGQRLRQQQAAVAAAAQAQVKHVVYTSMPRPEAGSPIPFAPDHRGTEEALAASGLRWTVLRNSWYAENLLGALPAALASGSWYVATGDGLTSYVTREDCAQVAAAVLLQPEEAVNTRFEVTGPEALSSAEIAALASEVFGKPLQAVQVSEEGLAHGLAQAGLPDFFIPVLVSFDVNTKLGRAGHVSQAVAGLTGRVPQGLRAFFEAHRAAFLQPLASS